MKRIRTAGIALGAVFVMSAVVAAPAVATSEANPVWYDEGASLTEVLNNLAALAVNTQELTSSAAKTISCKKVAVNKEAGLEHLIANTDSGGVDAETLVYSECTYPESGCHVRNKGGTNGTIETNALESKLEYTTRSEAEKEEVKKGTTLTVFKPVTGSVFVEIEFDGSGCPSISEPAVDGLLAVENVGDAGTESGAELTEHELNAPSTLIKKAFYNEGGTTKEQKTELKVFGSLASAGYIGKSKVKLESGEHWGIQAGATNVPVVRVTRTAGNGSNGKHCSITAVGGTCTIRIEILSNPGGRALEITREEIQLIQGPGSEQGFGFERPGGFANECKPGGVVGSVTTELCEVKIKYIGAANPPMPREYLSWYDAKVTEQGGTGTSGNEWVMLQT